MSKNCKAESRIRNKRINQNEKTKSLTPELVWRLSDLSLFWISCFEFVPLSFVSIFGFRASDLLITLLKELPAEPKKGLLSP